MTIPCTAPALAEPDATARAAGDLRADGRADARPLLLGIGLAQPEICWEQSRCEDEMAAVWSLRGAARERWRRICRGSGVERRHGVMVVRDALKLSTQQRMEVYERFAPDLAAHAAREALASAAVDPADITDLIVVSCTGFAAPGVDAALVGALGLAPTVRRVVVGFMGCFGAISGLRAAVGACSAEPAGAALVVCVELCSLHMRDARDLHNQVASALFADGAAAAVVGGEAFVRDRAAENAAAPLPLGRLTTGASLLMPEGADWMTWRITDAGFAMTLTREVPSAIRGRLAGFVRTLPGAPERSLIVHPGGAGILDAVEDAMDRRGGPDLDAARDVLRRCGNMSSGTVLHVLAEALRRGAEPPGLLLAFGPGLTIESLTLTP